MKLDPSSVEPAKGASNADTKYLVKIDSKGVDYKEVANNANARTLSINFSKYNRLNNRHPNDKVVREVTALDNFASSTRRSFISKTMLLKSIARLAS